MPVTDAPLMERAREREAGEVRIVISYKCEDCGKIIASPSENPAPRCCGEEMRKIR
jgi:hypothetical protein